ncbi:MAG TPA: methylated-DNA--[protein]-cysteine S-methyltransferase [Methanospirillum sp.]|nr:methylated-DNA--[protein]-cysteine S-methyltransferase [Methanospirillum sp.]
MAISEGSCRFGLWFFIVRWKENQVHQARFSTTGIPGSVPAAITRYFAGMSCGTEPLVSIAVSQEGLFGAIYREVTQIPYGETVTYGEIARRTGTHARVVGLAMKRNITPVLIPCHRVLAAKNIGGFTPSLDIKRDLLALESGVIRKNKRNIKITEYPLTNDSLTGEP